MIDAVVVTANSCELVLRCLDHLGSPLISRVVAVDNGSTDDTAVAIERDHPEVDVVRLEMPRGLAFAFNRGSEQGRAQFVLFLNDDILASPQSVRALFDALNQNPSAVAAGGRLVDPATGLTQLEYQPRKFPTLATFVAAFTGLERLWRGNPWSGAHRRDPLGERITVPVDHVPGACLLVRRETLEKIGGWDEQYTFWFEDVDISRRLAAHGAVLYVPVATFSHTGGASARRLDRSEVVVHYYGGALRYAQTHFRGWQRLALYLLFAVVGAARTVLYARRKPELSSAYRSVFTRAFALAKGRRGSSDGHTRKAQ